MEPKEKPIPNQILEGVIALLESQAKHADALKLIIQRQEIQSYALAKMAQAMLEVGPMLNELKNQLDRIGAKLTRFDNELHQIKKNTEAEPVDVPFEEEREAPPDEVVGA